ncbi:cobalamin B12-binding domain-containing protein [Niveispirillum lacus]|nr:cobalamin-binding protein [Niveispirillum lacus]
MTAEKLATRYEIGLEHDRRYDAALDAFCTQVVQPGMRAAALLELMRRAIPVSQPDIVFVLFIEAAARQLGRKWIDDDCDFVDITIGTARLQEIIRLLSFQFRGRTARTWVPFVVLLTPVGEQHTLAQHILGLLFDAMGWSSQILEGKDLQGAGLKSAVRRADMICIGWSTQRLKQEFADLVGLIRSAAPASRTPIVAGGSAALEFVDFLVALGIDCICDSVYSASRICEKFYELETLGHKAQASGQQVIVSGGRPDWQLR